MMQKSKDAKEKTHKFTCVVPDTGGVVSNGVGTCVGEDIGETIRIL